MQIRAAAVQFSSGVNKDPIWLPDDSDKRSLGQHRPATYTRPLGNVFGFARFGGHGLFPVISKAAVFSFVLLLANHFAAFFVELVFN